MIIKFDYDFSPRKKGEVVDLEKRLAEHYINTGVAHEVCDDCKEGKKGCKDCGDTVVINEPKDVVVEVKEETKEPIKRTRKTSNK